MDKQEFDAWDEKRKQRRAERDARRSEQRQERRANEPNPGQEARKEKVLHTRISEQLDESLRSAANELRVPVSNLVRNVLEDVFDVVETVTENVEELVEDLVEEAGQVRERFGRHRRARSSARPRPPAPPARPEPPAATAAPREQPEFEGVLGWQPLVLNAAQRCAGCGRDLSRGDQAYMALGSSGASELWLCPECLRATA